MKKFLKGNYTIETAQAADEKADEKPVDVTALFESKALEKLGGSIAFVMKGNNFMWGEDDSAE